ncbi:MAG: hypothetical protein ACI909_000930 [Planctomycetota bacterium]|jgi:hypothetical protein
MPINGRIVLSGLMLFIFSGFLYMTVGYSPAARLMPMVVCIPALVLTAIQLAQDIHELIVDIKTNNISKSDDQEKQRAVLLICWFAALVICSILFGILVSGMIFIFTFLRFNQGKSVRLAITLAGVFILVIYLVFELIVQINLFEGLVFRLLAD